MTNSNPPLLWLLASVVLLGSLFGSQAASQESATEGTPRYDDEGHLLLPEDWRRWILVGTSLGLSYSEGSGGTEMFHETLLEPTAYDHFVQTGEFKDGAMFALLLHETAESALPQRRGRFGGSIAAIEMSVKDSRTAESWSYYGFGGTDGLRDRARAFGANSCNACHTEHAAHDNVFLQFYPMLAEVAPAGTVFATSAEVASAEPARAPEPQVALQGLDPVLLVDGHSELGKPEIVATHAGFTYQFVSEPTRKRFADDPGRYSIQNETCPVVPGAGIDPGIHAVHQGKIYAFASPQCLETFATEPDFYVLQGGSESTDG